MFNFFKRKEKYPSFSIQASALLEEDQTWGGLVYIKNPNPRQHLYYRTVTRRRRIVIENNPLFGENPEDYEVVTHLPHPGDMVIVSNRSGQGISTVTNSDGEFVIRPFSHSTDHTWSKGEIEKAIALSRLQDPLD